MFLQDLTNEQKSYYLYDLWSYIEGKNYHELSLSLNDYYKFNNSFAISKAEMSELTEEEALAIFNKNYTNYLLDENSERFINEFMDEYNTLINWSLWYAKHISKITKLHDKLEYNNIVNAMKYIDLENNPDLCDYVLNYGITKELLIKLHHILTYRMDDLFLNKGINHYSPYISWTIRDADHIKVWTISVWLAKDIEEKIELIRQKSLNIQNIFDVFEIHGIMYEAHIFNNGNKRISRIIESLLIKIYNFAPSIPISYGYYIYNDLYIDKLVNLVLKNKDYKAWADFSYASALLSWLEMLYKIIESEQQKYLKEFFLEDILHVIPKKEDFTLKELEKATTVKRSRYYANDVLEHLYDNWILDVVEYYSEDSNKTKELYIIKYENIWSEYIELSNRYSELFKIICSYSIHFANKNKKYVINQNIKEYMNNIERGLM